MDETIIYGGFFGYSSSIIVGDILKYSTRPAQSSDYAFLFELKKAAEFEPIKAVFGWDEQVQRDIHAEEWAATPHTT